MYIMCTYFSLTCKSLTVIEGVIEERGATGGMKDNEERTRSELKEGVKCG